MVQTIDMFCSNTVDSIEYGIGFADNIYGTMMELNVMTGCNIGLLLRNDGIIGQQGDTLAPSDNRWIGSDTLDSWADGIPATDGRDSPFWVRNVAGYFNAGLHDADYPPSDSIEFHFTSSDTAVCDSLTINKTGTQPFSV